MTSTAQLKKWQNEFGREYTDRNTFSLVDLDKFYVETYGIKLTKLNEMFFKNISTSARILEVGTNTANQLLCLQSMGFKDLYGIEPQWYAIEKAKQRMSEINIVQGTAFDIPFKDGYFDVVFTAGVLIHIHPNDIKRAMKEIWRCSNKYIWGCEYYAPQQQEIAYRGNRDLMWKCDFAKLYLELFPDLELVKEKKLPYLADKNIDSMFLLKKKGR